ncbi:MAG: alpha-2-macroglobulin domain-containing [Beijerinckiaceae bacterium]|nr:MAG: alpha-2-macroglobulin domain-containing [Beijerinckiaceae bacterium]
MGMLSILGFSHSGRQGSSSCSSLARMLGTGLLGLALMTGAALAQMRTKAFLRDDLAASGAAIEEKIKREVSVPQGMDFKRAFDGALAALDKKDGRAGLLLANQAVLIQPNSNAGWMVMSRAARMVVPRDWRERYEMQERALAAAYIGYARATSASAEGDALYVLGRAFEWREMWRPALTAYRISLEAKEDAAARTAYETLREKRGFRLTGNEVDADSASPRACFTFSEPLARGKVDFAPYVAVSGKGDFAVTAESSQICVDGLRHGERYGVVLRQGIPSSIPGENLLKNADYEIYVRDRTASVRASGKTYVLPRSGQQGVPLTSVNTDKIGIRVLRIGDRNLINTVRNSEFMEQMEPHQVETIIKESGSQVWRGVMDVKTELNKDVVTAFPVTEATGKLEPGIYLIAAQAGDFKTESGATAVPNPDGDSEQIQSAESIATQWFVVSDLGLTAFSGQDGVHVFVRSLANAAPVEGTEVRLIARNNEVMATLKTDAKGHAKFDPGLSRGDGGLAPGIVTAQLKDDYGFLDLQQAAFDLTDRGVSGRVAPKGLDAYLYAERGVYRPGETVYVTALVRDARSNVVAGLPLTIVVRRPDGMEYRRQVVQDQGGGGRAISVPLLSGAPVGTWRISAYSDPKRPAIGETTVLVEDYVPERLEINIEPKAKLIQSGENAEIDVNVRYLYGAPGADLSVAGDVTIRRAKESAIPGFAGYTVGLSDEPVEAVKSEVEGTSTDEDGKATLSIALKEPETNLPLEAEFVISASESGGRAVTRAVTIPIVPKGVAIGIKPAFDGNEIGAGDTAKFGVILATGQGKRLARSGLKWQLSRISRNYQWFFKDGRWAYEGIKTERRVADGEVATSETAVADIAAKVQWGTYRLAVRLSGSEEAETAYDFTVGYVADAKADTPDVLDVALDKKSYADGETMQVRLAPRFAGKATLAVISDRVAHLEVVDLPEGGKTFPIKVSADWGAGAYLVAMVHRPLDEAAKRMPGRALGLSWFTIGKEARKIGVNLGAPAQMRPRQMMNLPVKLANLKAGEEAFVTVAAVDVGILNLTRYQSPNATNHFYGQRQLNGEVRDLYAYLIDGMQGTRGAIRSGGDAAPEVKGERPTQEPLARFSGVVKANADGTVPVSFEIPAFNGTVRVMAVAWTATKTGEAEADVIVRDPIVVQPTVPRFLALGDKSQFHIDINNVEGAAGDYVLDVDMRGPVSVQLSPDLRKIRLEKGKKVSFALPVIAAGLGQAEVDLTLKGGGETLAQTVRVNVKPSAPSVVNRIVRPLPGGQSLEVTGDLLADFVPNSGSVSVTVSPFAALDVPALLSALDRYPYGCTEQTVSRAMPLLYVNKLASMEHLALDDNAEKRISDAIERVLSRQGANGGFGLWSVGSNSDLWLDAFVTDFLTRARERNIAVPQVAFGLALDRLRNQVVNTSEVRKEEAAGLAYAIYVLARNGRPVMGDLRYLADNKLGDFTSPLSKGQIGAALALLGDRGRSDTVMTNAVTALGAAKEDLVYRSDYGSKLRDSAGLLALLAEANSDRARITRVAGELDTARNRSRYTSTQEQNWMVLAAQALAKEAENFSLTVDGANHRGALYRTLPQAALDRKALTIRNNGQSESRVILSVSGIPTAPTPALDEGFSVKRTIYSIGGEEVGPAEIQQNERYYVALEIDDSRVKGSRLLVVDPLPAGLEIENPKLTEANTEGMSFFGDRTEPDHVESRDDRFVAAFNRSGSEKKPVRVAYIVRAVTPGTYVHPATIAEDMYRPERFGRTAFGSVTVLPAEKKK